MAPFTTDGDLALNPSLLSDGPRLGQAMLEGHFALRTDPTGHQDPGTWVMTVTVQGAELAVPVDLIVPAGALAGARLGGHACRFTAGPLRNARTAWKLPLWTALF